MFFGELQMHPDKKWFKTGFATLFSFSSSLFFNREGKYGKKNQLPYKTIYDRNSPDFYTGPKIEKKT